MKDPELPFSSVLTMYKASWIVLMVRGGQWKRGAWVL